MRHPRPPFLIWHVSAAADSFVPLACSISGNLIGYGSDEGVKSLAEALKVNTGLKELRCATRAPPS